MLNMEKNNKHKTEKKNTGKVGTDIVRNLVTMLSVVLAIFSLMAMASAGANEYVHILNNGIELKNNESVPVGTELMIQWNLDEKDKDGYVIDYNLRMAQSPDSNKASITLFNYLSDNVHESLVNGSTVSSSYLVKTDDLGTGKGYRVLIGQYVYCDNCGIRNSGNSGQHKIVPKLESVKFNIVEEGTESSLSVVPDVALQGYGGYWTFGTCGCDKLRILNGLLGKAKPGSIEEKVIIYKLKLVVDDYRMTSDEMHMYCALRGYIFSTDVSNV
jgi:hypothetical protein